MCNNDGKCGGRKKKEVRLNLEGMLGDVEFFEWFRRHAEAEEESGIHPAFPSKLTIQILDDDGQLKDFTLDVDAAFPPPSGGCCGCDGV